MPRRLTFDDYLALARKRGMTWTGGDVPRSHEKSIWLCPQGHKWAVSYSNVRSGKNCPHCLHERLGAERRRSESDYAQLAASRKLEWIGPPVKKNNQLTKWRCLAKGHTFRAGFTNLARGDGCPYCSGRRVSPETSLAKRFPDIAAEWHSTLNGDLTPNDVTVQSNKKVWWQCKLNHEPWRTSVSHRTRQRDPTGCPYCAPVGTSKLEIRIYLELSAVFGKALWRYKLKGRECDVYVPNCDIGVEVDGRAWHSSAKKQSTDLRKTEFFGEHGVMIYRVREAPLDRLSSRDIVHDYGEDHLVIVKMLIRSILKNAELDKNQKQVAERYLKARKPWNAELYEEQLSLLPGPPKDQSLSEQYPKVASEWLQDRNNPITPEMVWPYSHDEYWWQCPNVPYHQYQRAVSVRTKGGQDCPLCNSRIEVHPKDSLAAKYPELAAQWHPTKNGSLQPDGVMPNSGKKVWWQCSEGHDWRQPVFKRTSQLPRLRCRSCETLAFKYPDVAAEWHDTRNHPLTPSDVMAKSGKKVWWNCSHGHEWQATVASRTHSGTNCPHCWSIRRRERFHGQD